MVKKLLLISAAVLFYFKPYAQKGKLEWGDLEKKNRNTPFMAQVLKGPGTDIITLGFRRQGGSTISPVISRFDEKLNQVMEKELFASEKDMTFNNIFNLRGNLVLFSKQYDKEERFSALHAAQIDPVTLAVTGAKELGKYEAIKKSNQATITVMPSPDSSLVLVMANAPYAKNENEKFFISVYDNKMNSIWEKTIQLPYADKYVVIDEFQISNEGDVYVMCKHYDREVSREKVREDGINVPSYKYKVFIYSKDKAKPTEHTIDVQDKFVHDIALQFNNDGNIAMMGLYKDLYNSNISGTFMGLFDKNTKLITVKKMEKFPKQQLVDLVSKDGCGSRKESNPGLYNRFRIIGTNKRNDGSVDLLTEYNYMYIHRTYNSSTGYYTEYPVYVADDIVVINYGKDGKISYARVPKHQRQTVTNANVSFVWMNQGNNLLLFYNDVKKNIDRSLEKGPKYIKTFSSSEFVMATINSKGDLQRESIFSNKGMDVVAKITSCRSVADNTLIIYAEKSHQLAKTRMQFGRLKFN
ncbi:hypothetical protein [Niastella yeongjuensis]|uniref:hypothetical protein n=1 Tax=Niastella yeongjuensis TaxID=354355 RepID=UPI001055A4C5|nr:hypothetical protein [Niastella yeongjuensis]